MIPVLLGASLLIFGLMQLVPGDPVLALLGEHASQETMDAVRRELNLDAPFAVRYLSWIGGVLSGDLGRSVIDSRDVATEFLRRLGPTLRLVTASMLIAVAVGVPIGIVAATRRGSVWDSASRVFALFGLSMPNFWVALILILVFSVQLGLLPSSGSATMAHLILPAVALGSSRVGLVMRLTRSTLLEVLKQDYVRTARAKGVSEPVVTLKHALRSAMLPVVTVIGLEFGVLLGGTVIIETVFSWPGIGRFTYERMLERDYPMIIGSLTFYVLILSLVNLVVDLLYVVLDPRITYD
jgi:peptide/nickel transport system permease protein